jgi:hypothetical protein
MLARNTHTSSSTLDTESSQVSAGHWVREWIRSKADRDTQFCASESGCDRVELRLSDFEKGLDRHLLTSAYDSFTSAMTATALPLSNFACRFICAVGKPN